MWLFKRRQGFLAIAALLAATACNFTPVYAPNASGSKLNGQVRVAEPSTQETYLVTRRLETRLGAGPESAPMALSFSVSHSVAGLGATATGGTTRYHRVGTLSYQLKHADTGTKIASGSVKNFTGYSATGNTAATLAAERDSIERLMTILADELIERLYLIDPDLLP